MTHAYFANRLENGAEARDSVSHIVRRLEELKELASAQAKSIGPSIAVLLGNVETWVARTYEKEGEVEQRAAAFGRAADQFAQGKGMWARFGRLEALREAGLRPVPTSRDYADVEEQANNATQSRTEPRSLTLLYYTALLCMLRQHRKSRDSIDGVLRLLRRSFGDVDGALTLYSQHWKTNVSREMFEDELKVAAGQRSGTKA